MAHRTVWPARVAGTPTPKKWMRLRVERSAEMSLWGQGFPGRGSLGRPRTARRPSTSVRSAQGRTLRRAEDRGGPSRSRHPPQPRQDRVRRSTTPGRSLTCSRSSAFDAYQWRFVDGRPLQNRRRAIRDIPARTAESDPMSRDLKSRRFTFVGSTIVHAHMQAVGMVNDHVVGCFRHARWKRGR